MVSGNTTTQSLADSLDVVVASARITREYIGVMPNLVDRQTLSPNTGTGWKEITLAQLTAQSVTETTELDNPQAFSDTAQVLTPQLVGLHTFVTDKTGRNVSRRTLARMGELGQNAMQRKKDVDGLTILDSFTDSQPGAGSTLLTGHVRARKARITSNATEPAPPGDMVHTVVHGFQLKDFEDELTAGVGTYSINSGLTQDLVRANYEGMLTGTQVHRDDNITIDGSDDAKGGVFARSAIILVQGVSPYTRSRDEPHKGGGGMSVFMYDEYIYGIRQNVWGGELYSDALAPTN